MHSWNPSPRTSMCKPRSKAQEGAHDPVRRGRRGGRSSTHPQHSLPPHGACRFPTATACGARAQGQQSTGGSGSLPTHWCTHTSSRGPTRAHRCQAAAGPLFRCRPGPGCQGSWEGRARLLEPSITGGRRRRRSCLGRGLAGSRAWWGLPVRPQGAGPGPWHTFPRGPLRSPWTLPPGPGPGEGGRDGAASLGPGDAASASGHSPSERCVFKRALSGEDGRHLGGPGVTPPRG